jgi:RNase adapter protein RapZ
MDQTTLALKDLVVITGLSGAGKSTAMAAFEDEGYFCVDNLPSEMIHSLVELFMHAGSKVAYAAVVCDVRAGSYFDGLADKLDTLRADGVPYRLLFLDAPDETLQTRYKETRRRHPLSPHGSVAEGIEKERELLAPLLARADMVVDTSGLTAAMLRRKLADELLATPNPGRLAVTFESFGFKYGAVRDPDLMFDVRFLPNPHYEADLRPTARSIASTTI